jgi:hypothetical protein
MVDESTVNSQVTDSVSQVVSLLTGQSPAQSFGMLDAVLLETLGMAMHNAVIRQQNASMTSNAAVTAACAKMLQARIPLPPPPAPPTPPTVEPLPGPPSNLSPSAQVAAANADAVDGVTNLQQLAAGSSTVASTAMSDLQAIATMAQTTSATGSSTSNTDSSSNPPATAAATAPATAAATAPATPPSNTSTGQ